MRESAVAAGIRRIEAVTGTGVLYNLREKENQIKDLAAVLKTTPADIAGRAEGLVNELKAANKEIETLRGKLAAGSVDSLIKNAQKVKNTYVITGRTDDLNVEDMRSLGDRLRDKVSNAVIVLCSVKEGKISFVAMATKDAVAGRRRRRQHRA
jgi:alanyl-tRNA synthetase